METRNLLVIGVWVFAIIGLVGTFMTQADILLALFLFVMAIIISVVATTLPTGVPSKT